MGCIEQRTSVRAFTDEPISNEMTNELLRAAMAAPSAGNQQPWEFYVVTNRKTLRALSATSPYAKPLAAAPLGIACCMRTQVRWPSMTCQDMAAATENVLLKAAELGLGAVWLGIYPEQDRVDDVAATLDVPVGLVPFSLIAVGHPAQTPSPKGVGRFDVSRIHSMR